MELEYSNKPEEEAKIAKAIVRDQNISFKKAVVVCDTIRNKNLTDAIALLEKVKELKQPVHFNKFQCGASHKTGVGMSRYPKKVAASLLEALKNAQANAEFKGLDVSKMKVVHAQANKGVSRRRRKPKGRWKAWKTQYVNLQVMAQEMN